LTSTIGAISKFSEAQTENHGPRYKLALVKQGVPV